MYIREQSRAILENCEIYNQNPTGAGVSCWELSSLLITRTLIRDCQIGLHTQYNSHVCFFYTPNNILRNCYIGVNARWNSTVLGVASSGPTLFQNCTIERSVSTGAITD
jgi:hypothetical protein